MKVPDIKTSLPGPKAKAMIDREAPVASPSLIKAYPLVVERAKGTMVEDVDGNRFLDFMTGIAVTITGHCHPRVVKVIREQAEKLIHICGTDFYYAPYTELCGRLSALGPGDSDWQVFLANSGAEAVEGAIKLARYHTKRQTIIAFHGAFHGRTCGAVSLTASKVKQRAGFAPLLPGIVHMPYANCYRCVYNLTYPQCDVYCVESWRDTIFKTTVSPHEVAAIVVEPIQGEGGHIVPPDEYMPRLRKLCDEFGILLIADEIQSGMGRTGQFFAHAHWEAVPDIITLGKGLGSGMPISAIMAKKEVMTWPAGSHGSTFGGNPVACVAALATLDLVQEGLMDNAARVGPYLKDKMLELQSRHPVIGDVRGRGLMLAMELVINDQKKIPDTARAQTLVQGCFQKGLLILDCGESSVRLAPPLIITEQEANAAVDIIDRVLKEID